MGLPCTSDHFGKRGIELAGRAIHPEYQRQQIGKDMLNDFISSQPVDLLTTYTRNPAILRMIGSVATALYPLNDAPELQQLATSMPHVSMRNGVGYHINRYAKGGLFQGEDPANGMLGTPSRPLKQHYPVLKNVRHALAVVASVDGGRK